MDIKLALGWLLVAFIIALIPFFLGMGLQMLAQSVQMWRNLRAGKHVDQ